MVLTAENKGGAVVEIWHESSSTTPAALVRNEVFGVRRIGARARPVVVFEDPEQSYRAL